MAFRLTVSVKDLFDNFYADLSLNFPHDFSEVPSIKEIEGMGYKLVNVKVSLGGEEYQSNQLRNFVEKVLRWGDSDIDLMGRSDYARSLIDRTVLYFDYGGKIYEARADAVITSKEFKIILNKDDLQKLKVSAEAKSLKK